MIFGILFTGGFNKVFLPKLDGRTEIFMKKFTAILIALLLVLAFAACVDKKVDTDGNVILPAKPTETTPIKNTVGGGLMDENGEIQLPRDEF